MPRPKKWRQVCCLPEKTAFTPVGTEFHPGEAVVMTVDEYETIRLIDHEGLTQEACGENMKIARTTVQQISNTAHTAEFLENPAAQAEGGAGLKAAQAVVDSGAEALLTVRCGENAAEVLKAAEIRIYKTEGAPVQGNLDAFQKGALQELQSFHAGYHGIR